MAVLYLLVMLVKLPVSAAARNLTISLQDKKISELKPEGLTLSFYSAIKNNSDRNYVLASYSYRVLVNSQNFFEQQVSPEEQVTIPARQVVSLHFPVKISYQYLTAVLPEGRKQASCLVTGDMYFRSEKNKMDKVPFTFSMDFPIFEFPEITFLPLAVKDLTLGGAEFTFSFQLKNPNPYDLLIKDLQVKLHLGDRPIYEGSLRGDKALEPGGIRTFKLPLMLDFFEMGRELRDNLERELVPFVLKAEVGADSAWGWLAFNLEKSDTVKKEKVR
ncbi:MAG TPA: hypothetical protein PLW38_07390 [Candidatus Saccharicenans sp.]|nr:hypothetical protein [Candidatus Saccharicenans sp.]